ncbi:MAG: hypothetical protein ACM3Y9_07760 [Ignavibacteria bacterium]
MADFQYPLSRRGFQTGSNQEGSATRLRLGMSGLGPLGSGTAFVAGRFPGRLFLRLVVRAPVRWRSAFEHLAFAVLVAHDPNAGRQRGFRFSEPVQPAVSGRLKNVQQGASEGRHDRERRWAAMNGNPE